MRVGTRESPERVARVCLDIQGEHCGRGVANRATPRVLLELFSNAVFAVSEDRNGNVGGEVTRVSFVVCLFPLLPRIQIRTEGHGPQKRARGFEQARVALRGVRAGNDLRFFSASTTGNRPRGVAPVRLRRGLQRGRFGETRRIVVGTFVGHGQAERNEVSCAGVSRASDDTARAGVVAWVVRSSSLLFELLRRVSRTSRARNDDRRCRKLGKRSWDESSRPDLSAARVRRPPCVFITS